MLASRDNINMLKKHFIPRKSYLFILILLKINGWYIFVKDPITISFLLIFVLAFKDNFCFGQAWTYGDINRRVVDIKVNKEYYLKSEIENLKQSHDDDDDYRVLTTAEPDQSNFFIQLIY